MTKRILSGLGISLILLTGLATAQVSRGPIERALANLSDNLLFSPDNTYDIGASGANRPKQIFTSGTIWTGGALASGQGFGRITFQSDGVFTFTNNASSDFSRLQFGGTTSSFPALKRNGTGIDVRLADDSGYANVTANQITAAVALNSNTTYRLGVSGVVMVSATAPTISSGFGTSPSILSSNGSATFRIDVGTGGAATSGVVGLPTATTGWNCAVTDMTTNIVTRQTASTTTTVTVTAASAWTAGDDLIFICMAY